MGLAAAAGIGAVGAIGGGMIAAGASKKASNAQVAAQREAMDAQERMFEKQTELQEPFRQGGMTAQNRLMELLGLQAPGGAAGGVSTSDPAAYGLTPFNMPVGLGLPGVQMYKDAQGNLVRDPIAYMQAHPIATPTGGTPAQQGADFGKYARDFGMQDFTQDPGYAFRLSEGQKAIDRSAAARGGLQSGSALKAAARFGQDMGSQEYQNAFNRYQVNRSNQLNPLQSLMGSGQSATNVMTNAAGNYGNQMAEGLTSIGNARASGYVGGANALTQGIGQALNFGQNAMYMNQMNNPGMSLNSMPYSSGSSLPYSGFNVPIGG